MTSLRPELETLPDRLRALPVDARGYPIPFFVPWVSKGPCMRCLPNDDGRTNPTCVECHGTGETQVPEFRGMDTAKWRDCVVQHLCWVCGQKLGTYLAFPIGPMCAITRTTAEPPSHRECAEWSVRNCPFLANPDMIRREGPAPDGSVSVPEDSAGITLLRNPGVTCLWMTRGFQVFNDGKGKPLIHVGNPREVVWWARGRHATHAEVKAAMETGLPVLLNLARQEGAFSVTALGVEYARALTLLPPVTEAP